MKQKIGITVEIEIKIQDNFWIQDNFRGPKGATRVGAERDTAFTTIRPQDIQINELFRKYSPEPVLVILDVTSSAVSTGKGLPMEAYDLTL